MPKERIRLTDERQQFCQQLSVHWLQYVDVSRADAIEIRNCHLALIRASLTKQHLAGTKHICKRRAFRDSSPASYFQVFRVDVLEADVTLETVVLRVVRPFSAKSYNVTERHSR